MKMTEPSADSACSERRVGMRLFRDDTLNMKVNGGLLADRDRKVTTAAKETILSSTSQTSLPTIRLPTSRS